MIVDVHSHFFPDRFLKALARDGAGYGAHVEERPSGRIVWSSPRQPARAARKASATAAPTSCSGSVAIATNLSACAAAIAATSSLNTAARSRPTSAGAQYSIGGESDSACSPIPQRSSASSRAATS